MELTAVTLPGDDGERILIISMEKKVRYVHCQHEDMWLGYLEEFPDYRTQRETTEELQENMKDVYNELSGGEIPNVRRVAKLQLS